MRRRSYRFALACVTCGASLFLLSAHASADTTLRWKFEKGKSYPFVMTQSTTTVAQVQGQKIESQQDVTIDLVWEIRDVDADGAATMVQTMKRIQSKITTPQGNVDYDTQADKPVEGPMAMLRTVLKGMVDQAVEMKINARGEIQDVKVPQAMLDTLKNTGPAAAAMGAMFSEDGLKKMMSQSMLRFPEEAVAPGKTWSEKTSMPIGPFGTMNLDRTYTYNGPDAASKTELIGIGTTAQITVKENAPLEMSIDKQEGAGEIRFDNARGFLIQSDLKQTMQLSIKVQGQQLQQDLVTAVSLKLQPESSPGQK